MIRTEYSYDAFIAYSRRNRRFVERLTYDLQDHSVHFFLDTLEIRVGDRPRERIEEAIDSARFFCLIISPASLKSFYVRKFELEAAFTKMAADGREDFILPILWQEVERMPLMLKSLHYLDFTKHQNYMENVHRLVRKIKLADESFAGFRIYKNVDTSMTGQMVGVGSALKQVPTKGYAVRVRFEDGRIVAMDVLEDGALIAQKTVAYDADRRVKEIAYLKKGKIVDTWRYVYGSKDGLRKYKYILLPDRKPHVRISYDRLGRKTVERYLNQDGTPDDSRGYSVVVFTHLKGGRLRQRFLNARKQTVKEVIEET